MTGKNAARGDWVSPPSELLRCDVCGVPATRTASVVACATGDEWTGLACEAHLGAVGSAMSHWLVFERL